MIAIANSTYTQCINCKMLIFLNDWIDTWYGLLPLDKGKF